MKSDGLYSEDRKTRERAKLDFRQKFLRTKFPKYNTYNEMNSDDQGDLDNMVKAVLTNLDRRQEREKNIANSERMKGFYLGMITASLFMVVVRWLLS